MQKKLSLKIIKNLICAGFFLALCSCEQLLELKKERGTNYYSYRFNVNNCDTGERIFNDRISMCNALKNNSANNNCAYNERYAKFRQDCYDMSWGQLKMKTELQKIEQLYLRAVLFEENN